MKSLTRVLICMLILSVMLFGTSVIAGAEDEVPEKSETEVGAITPTEDDEALKTTPEQPNTTGTGEENDIPDNADENLFAALFEAFRKYSGEIMSLLSLIASVILAFCYKNGLTPLVKNGLSGLLSAVTKLKENVDAGDENSKNIAASLTARLESAETLLDKLTEGIDRVTVALDERERSDREREDLNVILKAQIDMLYDIFMTSALPQYQKDAVGERIREMKSALAHGASENDA